MGSETNAKKCSKWTKMTDFDWGYFMKVKLMELKFSELHGTFSHLRKTKYLSPDENIVPDQEFLGIYWYHFSVNSSG